LLAGDFNVAIVGAVEDVIESAGEPAGLTASALNFSTSSRSSKRTTAKDEERNPCLTA